MYNQLSVYRGRWDRVGIGASLLCVLHCLLAPLLFTALPAVAAAEHETHSAFAVSILMFGTLAFIPGYLKHRRKLVPAAGLAGVCMIVLAAVLPEVETAELAETLLVLVGGITLISAHLRNAWWCRYCSKCSDGDCAV